VRDAVDGDVALGHRLEQRGLRLRRRAVDLVGEEDVREDRPGRKTKSPVLRSSTGEPVMSAGSRSGVHWMREVDADTVADRRRASIVLPVPG
jgi:hypothetical protein